MKISLNIGVGPATKATQAKLLENDVVGAADGDWNCKTNLMRTFLPLITSLAQKRSTETAKLNKYVEAGKDGLMAAAKKYKPGSGVDNFHIFALDFIEKSMDKTDKPTGFFAKLFGG